MRIDSASVAPQAALFLAGLVLVSSVARVSDAEETATVASAKTISLIDLPPVPPGYSSRAAILAEIATGKLKLIRPEKQEVLEGVREVMDLEYGQVPGRSLQLDLALPRTAGAPTPGLIFIHGGAWSGGERTIYHYYTRRFAQRGFAAATISYRLSDEATYPAAVHDTKCAVRWMRANAAQYNIDAARIAVIGGSAGGHLSMMVGYSDLPELEGDGGHAGVSSRVAAVVNFYGPVDLTGDEGQRSGAVRKFLGGTYEERQAVYQQASPISHLDATDPPTLVIHGSLDDTVSIAQSDKLVERLKSLQIPHAYVRLEGWPHTLDAAEVVNQYCQEAMLRFFQQTLAPSLHPQP